MKSVLHKSWPGLPALGHDSEFNFKRHPLALLGNSTGIFVSTHPNKTHAIAALTPISLAMIGMIKLLRFPMQMMKRSCNKLNNLLWNKKITAQFGNYYAHGSPQQKALFAEVFPFVGASKNAPVNVDPSSSSNSDQDISSFACSESTGASLGSE